MEASLDETNSIPASGQSDFWERGSPAIALGNWSQGVGMTVSEGNVCSDALGFCFSIHLFRSHPPAQPLFKLHDKVDEQAKCQDAAPSLEVDRRCLKNSVHEGHIGESHLQDDDADQADYEPRVGKEADLKDRIPERTCVQEIKQIFVQRLQVEK